MKTTIKLFSLGMVAAMSLASCSDSFLENKKNYDNVNTDIYNYYSGCNGRVNDVYSWCLPTTSDQTWKYPSMGNSDISSQCTEEYCGFTYGDNISTFVDPQNELSSMSSTNPVPDYFMGTQTNIQEAVYGRIRNVNDVIKGISNGSLPDDQKKELLGQVYFFRAWCYYNLFKWYGGVPIVTDVLDPVEDSFTARSSAHVTYEFILNDLATAAEYLNGKVWTGTDYGRVTSGTALALKGRVMLLWCSPLFNRTNDPERWNKAYAEMQADKKKIDACGYGLFHTANNVNGSDFASMFSQINENPEAVFFTLYNNVASNETLANQKNNTWEKGIRPSNTGGSGKEASQMLIDLFPMSDGKVPEGAGTYTKLETSSLSYDSSLPFLDRDPRFYRTFCFPGFRWAYNGDASERDPNSPSDGKNYTLWNYVWYTNLTDQGDPESGDAYGADNLLKSKKGVYVRKKSDDLDVNSSPLYQYVATDTKHAAPFYSAAPLIELRYAEVLLNLAEVCAATNHLDSAVTLVKQIRERAGYTATDKDGNATNYGIAAAASSDQATCLSQVLYERQIEFAYEGKRFDDLRRWMLFDGGTEMPSGAPASWKLTGWGGNTCTYLGFTPLNGKRREKIVYRVADSYGIGGTTYDSDPLLKAGTERPEGVNLMKGDLNTQLETLATWYRSNLKQKIQKGDGYDSSKNKLYINFRPQYYFLGLSSGASSANKGLPQTIGWADYNNAGANGTFDPLAE